MAVQPLLDWFAQRNWKPFDFQIEVWNAYLNGESGLIHSATGTGKTYAAWLGPVAEALSGEGSPGLKVLWITPLRALAADTLMSLQLPVHELQLPWDVQMRTGDTSTSDKAKQVKDMPACLVTTPESLSIMLSREDSEPLFTNLRCVVVDEWHELMSTKRGVQTELVLARLRKLSPNTQTWGVSATLGNLEEAMNTMLGPNPKSPGRLVQGATDKQIVIDSILPPNIDRFPWAGHFGTAMIGPVVEAIEDSGTCLVFTNTRSQSEIWFRGILDARPEWQDLVALHHGSLSREVRDEVELGLKDGRLKAVVCTSSLDLGVDFSPVDRVLQLGSPKGVARLLQRAGRSGHRPGVASRVTCVPTHALEIVDIASVRNAAKEGRIESREGLVRPLDILTQHLVTIAVGPGFRSEEMFREVRDTHAYRDLGEDEWNWALNFISKGGESLKAYPEFRRVVETEGFYKVEDKDIAHRHRMSIGTIMSDVAMHVQYLKGSRLGTVEESFLARLSQGDKFLFAGKPLEFVRIKDMTAWVKPARSLVGAVPRWAGGRMALSGELSYAIRQELGRAKQGELNSPEMEKLAPLLTLQAKWSAIPDESELLIERVETEEGHHLFIYPIEGRLVHQGLAALFAYRIGRISPITFSIACNDYGFELLAPESAPLEEAIEAGMFSRENLAEDIASSLNAVELSRRQFREIARIAGLVFQGYPGMNKSARQLQSSSGLFYDVFARFEPQNMLLQQANREVLERQLEQTRMSLALERLENSSLLITHPKKPTPLAFPLLIDRLRETVTSESVSSRIQRMVVEFESEADQE